CNPPSPALSSCHRFSDKESSVQEQVQAYIEEVRPLIQGHGGDVEFVSMDGHTVYLRLHGACHACPHAMMTLKNGIEAEMRERLSPELTVERVIDED
ncbi:MAG: NifU family protein, partial [Kiritimatiellae bacterium]|nr:NifU family protein [Kiritimatiellia bacterium]